MKKMFAFHILILPFVLTSCNWSKLIDKFTPKREGVTFAEFRAAAEEDDEFDYSLPLAEFIKKYTEMGLPKPE